MLDLTGQVFGNLVVLREADRKRTHKQVRRCWVCLCGCGSESVVEQYSLRTQSTKSCGCLRTTQRASVTHGHAGKVGRTSTYSIWAGLRGRCYNPGHRAYKWYGAKGITICPRWIGSFENFLEDMGTRPDKLTLDRIDGSKGYSPENCRWASMTDQAVNKASTRMITFEGKTQCLKHWALSAGMPYMKLYKRYVYRGWDFGRAIQT